MLQRKSQKGMSLIEVLVALVLSLVLMAGVLSIMMNTKKTYAVQEQLAKLQENARFVLDDISFGLRMAGYFGCSGQVPGNAIGAMRTATAVTGENNQSIREADDAETVAEGESSNPSNDIVDKSQPRSDTLVITYFGPEIPNNITTTLQPNTSELAMATGAIAGLSVGDQIILSDCGNSRVYAVRGSTEDNKLQIRDFTMGNNQLNRIFQWPVQVFAGAAPIRYEVRGVDQTGDGDAQDPDDNYALFRTNPLDVSRNLIRFADGVENLQIRYGVDKTDDNIANIYQDQPVAGRVVSVRVTLLMRTMQKRYDVPETTNRDFQLGPNTNYNPSDNETNEQGYRHRLFTTVVKVRNQ